MYFYQNSQDEIFVKLNQKKKKKWFLASIMKMVEKKKWSAISTWKENQNTILPAFSDTVYLVQCVGIHSQTKLPIWEGKEISLENLVANCRFQKKSCEITNNETQKTTILEYYRAPARQFPSKMFKKELV